MSLERKEKSHNQNHAISLSDQNDNKHTTGFLLGPPLLHSLLYFKKATYYTFQLKTPPLFNIHILDINNLYSKISCLLI